MILNKRVAKPVVAHDEIVETTTSGIIDMHGMNSALVQINVTVAEKLWTVSVLGSIKADGTYAPWYEQTNTGTMTLMSYQTETSKGFVFRGVPNFIKLLATEDESGATVSVLCQPIDL
jgi:hypothetical protein